MYVIVARLLVVFYCFGWIVYAQPLDRNTFSGIYKKVKNSVVTINLKTTAVVGGQPRTVEGSGSGVIVSSDGLIVTNKHVVNDTIRSFKVILPGGKEYGASFVGMASDTDLSIIKLDSVPSEGVAPVILGNSDNVEEGEWVLVIGSPFGLGGSLSAGVVSAKERVVPIPTESGRIQPHTLIQTDASINPGNSGGALVNLDGEFVGIPMMNLSSTGTSAGVGFAIPVNVVKRVIQDIVSGKKTVGWLGVLVQDVAELTPTMKKQLGISIQSGIVVTSLELGGPAQKAGIKQYDVILAVNGQNVSDVTGFQWFERNLSPGDVVNIKIQRRGSSSMEEIKLIADQVNKQKTGHK